eukprot:COSAG06_NODE_3156_length_5758_cov_17.864640_3_plen_34_part_00
MLLYHTVGVGVYALNDPCAQHVDCSLNAHKLNS